MGGPPGPGGPGGRRGPGGRGGGPVAANATGAEIFQAKCQGCHGAGGAGGRAPALTAVGSRPNADLHKTIHDGKGRMPAMAGNLTDAQIDTVITYLKTLGGK
jgi:cytochrome c6